MIHEGITLGEFEILEQIGQGGMGAVYKARQTALRRLVAIKTLQPALASDAEYVARFLNEAVAAAGLNHPNLVQVYSAGEADGLHYFAMEYVEGESAQDRLKRKGRIAPGEAIAIAMNVATALDYGWRKAQLIHRDIKPDNIFLSGDGEVKLGDLGLAKSLSQSQSLTMTGASMGTPHYISPEQAEGKKDIDLRTDIYSLGCTLFHLLSGQPPYGGDSAVSVMMKHISAPVPDLRSVWPECPPALAATVAKAMQKSPAARQQTYGELSTDLRRAYDALDEPAPAARKSKKPLVLIGVAVAAAVAIAALVHFAPWKKGAPPGTATPLAALEPGAIRLWDSPEKAKGVGVEWEDGAVRLDKHGSLWTNLMASRDAALRAQIRMNSDAVSPQIWLRAKGKREHGDEMFYSLGIADVSGGKTVRLDTVINGRRQMLKEWPLSRAYGSDEWVRVELRVVGDELTASAEGHLLGTVHDTSQPQAGGAKLYATDKGYFRDIVYVPLDQVAGASSPDALHKWIGSVPWTPVDVPAAIKLHDDDGHGTAEWKDGKLRLTSGYYLAVGGLQRAVSDAALRVRVAPNAAESNLRLEMRASGVERIVAGRIERTATGNLAVYDPKTKLKTLEGPGYGMPPVGQGYTLELYAVGDTFGVLVDGKLVSTLRSAAVRHAGRTTLAGTNVLAESVEFKNLDPLTSAAATGGSQTPRLTPPPSAGQPQIFRLSPSTEPWVDAMSQPDLLKVAVKEGAALRMAAASLGHNIDLTPELKDGAVRMLFSGAGARVGACSVNVRRTETASYHFHMETNYLHVGIGIFDSAGNRTIKSDRIPPEAQRPEDAPVELELRVTGTTLIAKANGLEAARIEDSSFRQGHLDIRLDPGVLLLAVQTLDLSKPAPQPAARNVTPATATKTAPFVNSLGMKFVPVPGTKVLFSIWDTRMKDYGAYARTNKVEGAWGTQQKDGVPLSREPTYPVVGVNWADANAFCQWLTAKENAEGALPQGAKYRLPTDEEWSRAVGLPTEIGATPAEKSGKNAVDFPWGTDFPPKKKVGNYADTAFHEKFPNALEKWMEDYADGFATTSPVGEFPANAHGLYDMGGNVWQWCEDWYDASQKDRVLRGAAWSKHDRSYLLSSYRRQEAPGARTSANGFRCVLELAPSPAPAGR